MLHVTTSKNVLKSFMLTRLQNVAKHFCKRFSIPYWTHVEDMVITCKIKHLQKCFTAVDFLWLCHGCKNVVKMFYFTCNHGLKFGLLRGFDIPESLLPPSEIQATVYFLSPSSFDLCCHLHLPTYPGGKPPCFYGNRHGVL